MSSQARLTFDSTRQRYYSQTYDATTKTWSTQWYDEGWQPPAHPLPTDSSAATQQPNCKDSASRSESQKSSVSSRSTTSIATSPSIAATPPVAGFNTPNQTVDQYDVSSHTQWPTNRLPLRPTGSYYNSQYAQGSSWPQHGSSSAGQNQSSYAGQYQLSYAGFHQQPYASLQSGSHTASSAASDHSLTLPRGTGTLIKGTGGRSKSEKVDPSFCIRHKSFFEEGRVLAVIMTETAGVNSATDYNTTTSGPRNITSVKYEDHLVHTQTRRFVVVRQKREFCFACPIFTYNGRATKKRGVRASEHGIAYSMPPASVIGPVLLAGEVGITKISIGVDMAKAGEDLHVASRIYYGIHHPIQYNVKVKNIGKVPDEQIPYLIGNWKQEDSKDLTKVGAITEEEEDTDDVEDPPPMQSNEIVDPHMYNAASNRYGYDSTMNPHMYHPTHNQHGYHPELAPHGYHPQSNVHSYHPRHNVYGHHPSNAPFRYHPVFSPHGHHPTHNYYGYHPTDAADNYHPDSNPNGYHPQINPNGFHPQINPSGYHPYSYPTSRN